MRTLVVLSRKGGTGKTTVSVNLTLAAHLRGCRTLIADVDPLHSSHYALSARNESGPAVLPTAGGKLFTAKASAAHDQMDLMVIDTPSGLDANVLQALQVADFCVLVTRPNYLDLAAAAMTSNALRQLNKPALIVLNQAPPKRGEYEAPTVRKAREALRFANYPVADTALCARAAYGAAMAQGLSAEEYECAGPAAREIDALWREIDEAAKITPQRLRASK